MFEGKYYYAQDVQRPEVIVANGCPQTLER